MDSPQVDEKQLQHIQRLIEHGKKDGTLVHGGNRYGDKVIIIYFALFDLVMCVCHFLWFLIRTQ